MRKLIDLIDEALHRFGGRDILPASEVLDALLDIRLASTGEDKELETGVEA